MTQPNASLPPVPAPLLGPNRILMGPGPSDVSPQVLAAMARPTMGHLDPAFLQGLDEIRTMLQQVFRTENGCTLPVSGTGSAGMETCLVNLIEPGDRVLIGVNGVFGTRMAEVARRAGAEVLTVEAPWGRALDPDDFVRAAAGRSIALACVVHAETSTGVCQEMEPIARAAQQLGAMLLVDTVTSLGGVDVRLDDWGIDAAYSGTQKCLSCPPGLSPISLSERAVQRLRRRKHPVQSWYLDLNLVGQYWGAQRVYHHTAPVNALYGLHEALRSVLTEGLPARIARHQANARALAAGLEALQLQLPVPPSERLAPLTLVSVPDGVDEAAVRKTLLQQYQLEIGGGLGKFQGNAWRIGTMGESSSRRHVALCLTALASALKQQGHPASIGDALQAADATYAQ